MISAGTRRGTMIQAALETGIEVGSSRARQITGVTPSGVNSYDILMGMGEANLLYNPPDLQNVLIIAVIRITDDADDDLLERIKDSWAAFLDDFTMGQNLQYSDVIRWMYNTYDPAAENKIGAAIYGIAEIIQLVVRARGQMANTIGSEITAAEDWRLYSQEGDFDVQIGEYVFL